MRDRRLWLRRVISTGLCTGGLTDGRSFGSFRLRCGPPSCSSRPTHRAARAGFVQPGHRCAGLACSVLWLVNDIGHSSCSWTRRTSAPTRPPVAPPYASGSRSPPRSSSRTLRSRVATAELATTRVGHTAVAHIAATGCHVSGATCDFGTALGTPGSSISGEGGTAMTKYVVDAGVVIQLAPPGSRSRRRTSSSRRRCCAPRPFRCCTRRSRGARSRRGRARSASAGLATADPPAR